MKKYLRKRVVTIAVSLVAFIAVTVAVFSTRTAAFFSDNMKMGIQTIHSGDLTIELRQATVLPGTTEPVFTNDPIRITPGTTASKIVTVKNVGDYPTYIRVKLSPEIALSAEHAGASPDLSLVGCEINTYAWTYYDGYYYCNQTLQSGQESEPLFTAVTFAPQMDNTYTNSTVTFHIDAQAVQANHNGASALEAEAWPQES